MINVKIGKCKIQKEKICFEKMHAEEVKCITLIQLCKRYSDIIQSFVHTYMYVILWVTSLMRALWDHHQVNRDFDFLDYWKGIIGHYCVTPIVIIRTLVGWWMQVHWWLMPTSLIYLDPLIQIDVLGQIL